MQFKFNPLDLSEIISTYFASFSEAFRWQVSCLNKSLMGRELFKQEPDPKDRCEDENFARMVLYQNGNWARRYKDYRELYQEVGKRKR